MPELVRGVNSNIYLKILYYLKIYLAFVKIKSDYKYGSRVYELPNHYFVVDVDTSCKQVKNLFEGFHLVGVGAPYPGSAYSEEGVHKLAQRHSPQPGGVATGVVERTTPWQQSLHRLDEDYSNTGLGLRNCEVRDPSTSPRWHDGCFIGVRTIPNCKLPFFGMLHRRRARSMRKRVDGPGAVVAGDTAVVLADKCPKYYRVVDTRYRTPISAPIV
ncbi:hypothetical protein EVAR_10395_1 [Eumeta japonica]|uniref:Uncharacterized protein n=1 Tax=Eumeta variegata TaxID=151549 RepID=A0A4C1UCK1_EUMVA|nr:hypothetical protein EVAR_10395_1 [Eumeta japonica]